MALELTLEEPTQLPLLGSLEEITSFNSSLT